jgi:hypothetical protein
MKISFIPWQKTEITQWTELFEMSAVALSCWQKKHGFLFYSETSNCVFLRHKQLTHVGWCISAVRDTGLHNWKGITYWYVHSFRGKKGPNKPSHTQHTTHQPWHQVMALQGLMRNFLQMNTFYSETSHIHWDVIEVFYYTGHKWSLFI